MKKTELKGPLYKYLGHFKQQKYLDEGHNTTIYMPDQGGPRGGAPGPGAVQSITPNKDPLKSNVWTKATPGGGQRFRIFNDAVSDTATLKAQDRMDSKRRLLDEGGWANERVNPAVFNERPKVGPR